MLAIKKNHIFKMATAESPGKKQSTFDRKTDNPSQLTLESSAPARSGFELKTSVMTG